MGRRLTGSVLPHGDRFRAFVGREYLGIFDSKPRAWQAIKAWLELANDTGQGANILRRYGAAWLDKRETAGHVRGIHKERSFWRAHIETAPFIDWPMRRIKPVHIQKWLADLFEKQAVSTISTKNGVVHRPLERTLSRQTVAHCRRVLLQCFAQARIEGKVSMNPVEGVPVPKVDRVIEDEDTWSFLTVAEIEKLFATLPTLRLRAFFAAAIYAGLRDGELLGLRWQDVVIDGDSPHVKVRRSYDGPTKTKGSRREVPLLPAAREAIRAWRREGGVVKASGLVWPSDHGGCYDSGYDAGWSDHRQRYGEEIRIREGWRTKAGIRSHIRLHDLRHTCASHLIMGTWTPQPLNVVQVRQWLGHASISTTMRYAHLAPGNLHDAIRGAQWQDGDRRRDG